MNDRACLVVLPEGSAPNADAILEAARSSGLDPNRLRILMSGRALAAAARGSAIDLAAAAKALSGAGLASILVTDAEARALPPLQVAGGVAADDAGGVSLRVHGRPIGPPTGVPLLFVVADLGREQRARGAADARPGDSLRQRILRAVFPVLDVVWAQGRVRVPLKNMAWRSLPGASPWEPTKFLRLLEMLAGRSAGTVVDLGFVYQDLAIDPLGGVSALIEGADRDHTALFNRYSAAAAMAWSRGLYPSPPAGEVATVGAAAVAVGGLARFVKAQAFFGGPVSGRPASPVSWVRRGRGARSRVRLRLWPWLALGPAAFLAAPQRLSVIGLAVAGAGAVSLGLRALSLSEKLRSMPLSKVRSMAMGRVEISGRTAATAQLKTPYSQSDCVWYHFEVKDLESVGDKQELLRTIAEGSSSDMPFLVEDATGSVLVQPADAEIDVEPETITPDSETLVREWFLPVGATVFVTGFAQRRSTDTGETPAPGAAPPGRDEVFIGSSPGVPFTIATQSRREEQARLRREFLFGSVIGGAYLATALLLWLLLAPLQ